MFQPSVVQTIKRTYSLHSARYSIFCHLFIAGEHILILQENAFFTYRSVLDRLSYIRIAFELSVVYVVINQILHIHR